MVNEFKLSPGLYKSIFLLVLLFVVVFFPTCTAALNSPWELNEGETLREGLLGGIYNNNISIITNTGILQLPLEPQPLTAIMGIRYGRLVLPEDFPPGLNVELFVTPQGTVRAIRNKVNALALPEGHILPGWGHSASLSPDGEHYLIFNLESGLFLHSLSPDQPPLFLSHSTCAAWNKSGSKVVYSSGENLSVYDIAKEKEFTIPLETARDEPALIVTDLAWNYSGDRLFYASLRDYPNLGSDLFQITILDSNGKQLAVKIVPNLGAVTWLKNDLICYVTFKNIEQDTGEALLWDYRTGQTSTLLPEKKGGYHNICCNSEKEMLAYTVAGRVGEELYVLGFLPDSPLKILSLPLPVRNLQWSKHNSLFYWDYMNEHIYEVKDLHGSAAPIARANGYLPPGAAGDKLIYFLSEPFEEPQQPFLLD